MPVLPVSSYKGSGPLANGHVQTMFPVLFRPMPVVEYHRQRLETPDGDFLDVDFSSAAAAAQSESIAVISHGLEGHSRRRYVQGMARVLNARGWDAAAWNFRGCSGQPNRLPRMYHSGDTQDLHTVVAACAQKGYRRILLAGVSMGGNQILKYLGEDPDRVDSRVCGAVVFSVPCDLVGAAQVLGRPQNSVYMRYFLRTLRQKIKAKHAMYPDTIQMDGLDSIRTFAEFDDRYTAPLHGFSGALDYWTKSSCRQFLSSVRVPALLVNALNDPFLSASCYPYREARQSGSLFFETTVTGGHVGFVQFNRQNIYWSEERLLSFMDEQGL